MSFSRRLFFGLNITFFAAATEVHAQIIPDATLGRENSTLTPNQIIEGIVSDRISGGARRGANLFHSFQEFNIESGRGVYFDNPDGVTNILSRVTGNNASKIFGRLGVLGDANLLFLNPNGIIFGENASLDISGSFLATTASSIHLADGTIFSADKPQPVPLLAVNVPRALGFLESPGAIEVRGNGHNLIAPGDTRLPNLPFGGPIPAGVSIEPKRTLALIGGKVTFNGGVVTAPSGRIEIGSVASTQVKMNFSSATNFSLSYPEAENFQDIALTQKSLLNASGVADGNIQIVGRNINLTDASLVFVENQGANPNGAIVIDAQDSFTITGTTEYTPILAGNIRFTRGLVTQALKDGKGADVNISARRVVVQDSGRIYLSTFGSGAGGNLRIRAAEEVEVLGISAFDPSFPLSSIIATATIGSGEAGTLELTTENLSLQGGGLVSSSVFGNGKGGDLRINGSSSIVVSGFNPNSLVPSSLTSINQGNGQAGNLSVNTNQLIIQDGGRVDTSTLASGNAGNLTINADSINLSGTIPGSINPSLIISSANLVEPFIQIGLGLPEIPTGASGNVSINTRHLKISDGALISVRNDGTGDGGTLKIQADSIKIENNGGITASTISGTGGDIELMANQIQQRQNSDITATGGGMGNGGNVFIQADSLVALEDSDILANAFAGEGGNISIFARGIFLDLDSDITASSELGIDGTVVINNPDQDIQSSLELLEAKIIPPSSAIAGSCLAHRNKQKGSFTYTGTGGIPIAPESSINERESVSVPLKIQPSSTSGVSPLPPEQEEWIETVPPWQSGDPIIRGQKLVQTKDGRTLLVAAPLPGAPISAEPLICH